MKEYPKIQTLWKREPEKPCNIIIGTYANPEFELLKDLMWECTEKVDGTNVRVMWDGRKLSFGGKTDRAQMPMFLHNKLSELFEDLSIFRDVFGETPACLYGEGYGARIQKGGGNYNKDDVDFTLFDVKIEAWWLKRDAIQDIADKFQIDVVPIVLCGTLPQMSNFVEKGFDSTWGNFMAEGVVAKPIVELRNRRGERIVTKLKHKDFLKLRQK